MLSSAVRSSSPLLSSTQTVIADASTKNAGLISRRQRARRAGLAGGADMTVPTACPLASGSETLPRPGDRIDRHVAVPVREPGDLPQSRAGIPVDAVDHQEADAVASSEDRERMAVRAPEDRVVEPPADREGLSATCG